MGEFKIEYEITDIEYNYDDYMTIETSIFLQILFFKENFNKLTGLNWDGSKEQIKGLKKILIGKKFGLDLGIKEALEEQNIEENKIIVKFPEKFDSDEAIIFCAKYVTNSNVLFDNDIYEKKHTVILLSPINYKENILKDINYEGVPLGIAAMSYKDYLGFKELNGFVLNLLFGFMEID